jgi:hypothetical protein
LTPPPPQSGEAAIVSVGPSLSPGTKIICLFSDLYFILQLTFLDLEVGYNLGHIEIFGNEYMLSLLLLPSF